jgi:hypothetical protein
MNGISYAPLQLWELFHLEVLRRLAQKLKPGQYALKGGVNMRFFSAARDTRKILTFISALHLHGIIEQIPQVITCASVAHTRVMKTAVGTFSIHRIAPDFFSDLTGTRKPPTSLSRRPKRPCLTVSIFPEEKAINSNIFPSSVFPRHSASPKPGAGRDR